MGVLKFRVWLLRCVCPQPAACGVLPKENSARRDKNIPPPHPHHDHIFFITSTEIKSRSSEKSSVPWGDGALAGIIWRHGLTISFTKVRYSGIHRLQYKPVKNTKRSIQSIALSAIIFVTCILWWETEWGMVLSQEGRVFPLKTSRSTVWLSVGPCASLFLLPSFSLLSSPRACLPPSFTYFSGHIFLHLLYWVLLVHLSRFWKVIMLLPPPYLAPCTGFYSACWRQFTFKYNHKNCLFCWEFSKR